LFNRALAEHIKYTCFSKHSRFCIAFCERQR